MFTKIAPIALLSAAALAAPAPVEERSLQSLHCLAQDAKIILMNQDAQATAFCSSYLSIGAAKTSTVLATATETVTAQATTTVTSTSTGAVTTSTCAPQYANQKRLLFAQASSSSAKSSSSSSKTTSAAATTTSAAKLSSTAAATTAKAIIATPTYFAGLAASSISADCSCLSIPAASTATLTSSVTQKVTVTSTTTATEVTSVAPTATATQLYDLDGTYNASNAAVFQLYPNLDFPNNDAFHGSCGYADSKLTTDDGEFACTGWNDCMNICATASWGCVGVSYVPSWNWCYLKNEVPGNDLNTCGTVQSYVVQSGLNIAQGNKFAVVN